MEVMDSSAMVQEGFLCPMCMKDLGDFVQLQQHFSDVHTDKEDVFFPIKGKKVFSSIGKFWCRKFSLRL